MSHKKTAKALAMLVLENEAEARAEAEAEVGDLLAKLDTVKEELERTKGNLAAMQRDRDALLACSFASADNYRRLLVERDVALAVLVEAQWHYGVQGIRGHQNAIEAAIVALAPGFKDLGARERWGQLVPEPLRGEE
jgi:chromosome segregation ATPase